jgi:protein tyrosine phosphatase
MNANYVHPNLIATQCPLSSRPDNFENTVDDAKRMIIEQEISLWIQLSPDLPAHDLGHLTLSDIQRDSMIKGPCVVFPIEFFMNSSNNQYAQGIRNLRFNNIDFEKDSIVSVPYVNMSYDVHAYVAVGENNTWQTMFENPCGAEDVSTCTVDNTEWQKRERSVSHIWYTGWRDFLTPPADDDDVIRHLVEYTGYYLRKEETVAVSCKSGRGRSGTFLSAVIANIRDPNSLGDFIDMIVDMREHRDGLLETPAHFRYAARIAKLADPGSTECSNDVPMRESWSDAIVGFKNCLHFHDDYTFSIYACADMTLRKLGLVVGQKDIPFDRSIGFLQGFLTAICLVFISKFLMKFRN